MRTLFLLFLMPVSLIATKIEIEPYPPIKGTNVYIKFDTPITEVDIVYRPNSRTSKNEKIQVSPPARKVSWVPKDAGLAMVKVTTESNTITRNISIRFAHFPFSGIIVMVVAGIILLGGASFSIYLLTKTPLPPST